MLKEALLINNRGTSVGKRNKKGYSCMRDTVFIFPDLVENQCESKRSHEVIGSGKQLYPSLQEL
jgi:hypothetical protein